MLNTVKYGDNSLIVYVLTDVSGRQTYMIRGVKGNRSGNRAALFQPMFPIEFEGVENPKAQMHSMRDVCASPPLVSIPFDLCKSTIALFMAEVLYRLVREVEPNSPLFDFVTRQVELLDDMTEGVANFHLWFLVGLSRHLGFFPGNEYQSGNLFDIREGVFVPFMPKHGDVFSDVNSRILADMMSVGEDNIGSIKLGRDNRDEFLTAMLDYLNYHFDAVRSVRSVEILRGIFL